MNSQNSAINAKYELTRDRWLSGVAVIFGYLWLISGLDKILGGKFASGFANFASSEYLSAQSYDWYKHLIVNFIIPNGYFFAQLVQWGELATGIALLVASGWLFFRESKIAHLVVVAASCISFVIVLNVILAEGQLIPFVDTRVIYDEGFSLDYIVLLVSALLAAANFIQYRHKIKRPNLSN